MFLAIEIQRTFKWVHNVFTPKSSSKSIHIFVIYCAHKHINIQIAWIAQTLFSKVIMQISFFYKYKINQISSNRGSVVNVTDLHPSKHGFNSRCSQLPTLVICGGIWPKLLPRTSKNPTYLGRHIQALDQGSRRC